MKNILYIGNDNWYGQLHHLTTGLKDQVNIVKVFTQKIASKVQEHCSLLNIPYETSNINEKDLEEILSYGADFALVFGTPHLIKKSLLDALTFIGSHPTPLPERRGRHPVIYTILEGCRQSAATLFFLREGADDGDIIYQAGFDIDERETSTTLLKKLNSVYSLMLDQLLTNWPDVPRIPQDHSKATYRGKRIEEDNEIKPDMSDEEIEILIRALQFPYPNAYIVKNGEKIPITKIEDLQ